MFRRLGRLLVSYVFWSFLSIFVLNFKFIWSKSPICTKPRIYIHLIRTISLNHGILIVPCDDTDIKCTKQMSPLLQVQKFRKSYALEYETKKWRASLGGGRLRNLIVSNEQGRNYISWVSKFNNYKYLWDANRCVLKNMLVLWNIVNSFKILHINWSQ